jgi:hypothetical protein
VRRFKQSAILVVPVLAACAGEAGDRAPGEAAAATESVLTRLDADCSEWIDPDDPNETVHELCPGVSGYSLIVRRVESGRESIDVVTPDGTTMPLMLDEYVTRHMSQVSGEVEWRVSMVGGERIPIALILRIDAREDPDSPETITDSYIAVVRVGPVEACVTDRIPGASGSADALRSTADSAGERSCVDPLPPLPTR